MSVVMKKMSDRLSVTLTRRIVLHKDHFLRLYTRTISQTVPTYNHEDESKLTSQSVRLQALSSVLLR